MKERDRERGQYLINNTRRKSKESLFIWKRLIVQVRMSSKSVVIDLRLAGNLDLKDYFFKNLKRIKPNKKKNKKQEEDTLIHRNGRK